MRLMYIGEREYDLLCLYVGNVYRERGLRESVDD